MPDPMSVVEGAFELPITINASGTKSYLLATTNRFLDKDIRVVTSTAAAQFSVSNNVVYCSTAGYVAAGSASAGVGTVSAGTIDSVNSTATLGDPAYQSSGTNSGKFTITASGTVSAPTVTTAGYVSSTIGTKNSNGSISGTKVLNKVKVGVTPSTSTSKVTPVIKRTAKASGSWVDAANGAEVTSASAGTPYVQVDAAAVAGSLTVTGKVSVAGYGTTSQYATDDATTITTGSNAATTKYIPIKIGTIDSTNSTATLSGPTYASGTDNFTVTASGTVAAPSVTTEGYVSSSVGTKNNNGAIDGSLSLDKVVVGSAQDGTFTKAKPVIKRTAKSSGTWVDAASGAEVTSTSANTPYVQVDAAAQSATLYTKGKVDTEGYGTTSYYGTSTHTSHDVGSQAAATKYIPIKVATITATSTTATLGDPAYQSSGTNAGKFTITASGTINAPTISQEGYISSVVGSNTSGSAAISGTKVLNKVTVGADVSGTTTLTHSLSKGSKGSGEGWTDGAASGSAVSSVPSSGVYIKVDAGALSTTLTSTGKVTAAGYGTTTSGQYTAATGTETTVSASAAALWVPVKSASGYSASIGSVTSSSMTIGSLSSNSYPVTANLSIPATLSASTNGWFSSGTATGTKNSVSIGSIPKATFTVSGDAVTVATSGYITQGSAVTTISAATFANTATSGTTYNDISSTSAAPILISGSGLYINAGYVGDTYISLAKLIPDSLVGSNIEFAPANYILTGYAAWDADGVQITGTMQIYDGTYTVS